MPVVMMNGTEASSNPSDKIIYTAKGILTSDAAQSPMQTVPRLPKTFLVARFHEAWSAADMMTSKNTDKLTELILLRAGRATSWCKVGRITYYDNMPQTFGVGLHGSAVARACQSQNEKNAGKMHCMIKTMTLMRHTDNRNTLPLPHLHKLLLTCFLLRFYRHNRYLP